MPRYFFKTNGDTVRDPEDGVECADLQSVKRLAVRYAAHALEESGMGLFEDDFTLEVYNSEWLLLFTVTTFVTEAPAV